MMAVMDCGKIEMTNKRYYRDYSNVTVKNKTHSRPKDFPMACAGP